MTVYVAFFHAHFHCNAISRYSCDPLMDVARYVLSYMVFRLQPVICLLFSSMPAPSFHRPKCSYPLMFHILILLFTEGGLRVMMWLRGKQPTITSTIASERGSAPFKLSGSRRNRGLLSQWNTTTSIHHHLLQCLAHSSTLTNLRRSQK